MADEHLYLFALEITPMTVGTVYDELPLHCTLMHRFWSSLTPKALTDTLEPFFAQVQPILLTPYERLLLGPKKLAVSEVEVAGALKNLHMNLHRALNELGVEYTAPEWVGTGYRAHVTERKNAKLAVGQSHLSKAVYLIEVVDDRRVIRVKFELDSQSHDKKKPDLAG
ncbi:MAG: hypothetical protein ACREGD_04875 [Candidatus Saccharimonadales bacterium]